jgi:hypothetical protein
MTLDVPYATRAELKSRMHIESGDTSLDAELDGALLVASSDVNDWCGRVFGDSGGLSARHYSVEHHDFALVDDFSTSSGLIVEMDAAEDGLTFASTLTGADYQLEPLDGIVDGMPGWPFYQIILVGRRFNIRSARAQLRVTARWGWAAVPVNVKASTLILAQEQMKLPDAPFGVAGFGEFGPVRIRNNPIVQRLLSSYRREPVMT